MRAQIHVAPLAVIFLVGILDLTCGESLTNAIHRTQAAQERVNDLWCYDCDTMENGEGCVDVVAKNTSSFVKKCKGEEFICMVKRFSYTIHSENFTSAPKMWSLDRRCAVNCEAGCIVIGERTKLFACTSCCEKSLCNTGRGGGASMFTRVETGIGTSMAAILLQLLCWHGAYHRAYLTKAPIR